MGEAKIRCATAGMTVDRFNSLTGELVPVKQAGISYTGFQRLIEKQAALPAGQDARVPLCDTLRLLLSPPDRRGSGGRAGRTVGAS